MTGFDAAERAGACSLVACLYWYILNTHLWTQHINLNVFSFFEADNTVQWLYVSCH